MRISIQEPSAPSFNLYRIFVMIEQGRDRFNISLDSEGRLQQQKLLENGYMPVKPFLELPADFFEQLAIEMVKFGKEKNIDHQAETFLKGKLSATEKHLEDLRKNFDAVLQKLISAT